MTTRLKLLLEAKPICPDCSRLATSLSFHPIPDGVTTILTDWHWCCTQGHTWPAEELPDSWMPTSEQDLHIDADVARRPTTPG